jgi:cob(I)alamin adenosyltransferase
MKIYTKTGDDGTTGLLYGGRVPKDDLRTEAYGTSDEAVAVLGVARADCEDSPLAELILRLQRELFVVGAELATSSRGWSKLQPGRTKVTGAMVDALEPIIDEHAAKSPMPEEFVVPGETRVSALLDVARSVVRRCERLVVRMAREGMLADGECVRYLNRLSDLLYVLARYQEHGWTPLHG